ncbi:FecR family protein [Chitinophaga lutea]
MEERISYLFRQYASGKCSKKEYEEFFALIRASGSDAQLRALLQEAYAREDVQAPPPDLRKNTSRPRMLRLGVALAAAAVAGLVWWLLPGRELQKDVTARSEQKYLLLPDSTQVWLNAASTLEYPGQFDGQAREVYLSGEAYFDVQHAAERPFIIHTGKVSTTVLGTAFNIRAYPGLSNIVVSVSKGKVSVQYGGPQPTTLTEGQQLKVSAMPESTKNPAPSLRSNVAEAAPWKAGDLVYDNETIEDIAADLQRVYNTSIRIDAPPIKALRISTAFHRDVGLEKALDLICRLTDTQLDRREGTYIIR